MFGSGRSDWSHCQKFLSRFQTACQSDSIPAHLDATKPQHRWRRANFNLLEKESPLALQSANAQFTFLAMLAKLQATQHSGFRNSAVSWPRCSPTHESSISCNCMDNG